MLKDLFKTQPRMCAPVSLDNKPCLQHQCCCHKTHIFNVGVQSIAAMYCTLQASCLTIIMWLNTRQFKVRVHFSYKAAMGIKYR